jgi:hypothetical protein
MRNQTTRLSRAAALESIRVHLALWQRGRYSRAELKPRLVQAAQAYRRAGAFGGRELGR